MARVLIIGYGNPVRGDDGLGWAAAEMLRVNGLPETEILTVHQLMPELAEDASRTELVIFVDAAETGIPGEWRRSDVGPDAASTEAFTHHVSPAALVAAAGLLYGHKPRAVLFTMTGERFDFREGLSATVAAAIPALLAEVRRTASSA